MSDSNDALLASLLKEKEQLLSQHPELRAYEAEIHYQMSQVGPEPGARINKMFEMMQDMLENEWKPELAELSKKIQKILPAKEDLKVSKLPKETAKRRSG